MTEQELLIFEQILRSDDKEEIITYFSGPFNYNLPLVTEISSIKVGYKYVQTNVYEPLYNEHNELIGYPLTNGTEIIESL